MLHWDHKNCNLSAWSKKWRYFPPNLLLAPILTLYHELWRIWVDYLEHIKAWHSIKMYGCCGINMLSSSLSYKSISEVSASKISVWLQSLHMAHIDTWGDWRHYHQGPENLCMWAQLWQQGMTGCCQLPSTDYGPLVFKSGSDLVLTLVSLPC